MAPLKGKKPDLSGDERRPHDPRRVELECLFQIEVCRQAPADEKSTTDCVYNVRPAAIWDSMGRFKNFYGQCSWPVFIRLALTNVTQ